MEAGRKKISMVIPTYNEKDNIFDDYNRLKGIMDRDLKDYDYEISCAAGAIDIGDSSFSGLGHEKKISNPGSSGKMTFDCGVGNITVDFE